MDYYIHQPHPQSHFVNASINHSSHHRAEQSLQKKSNTQPPKKSFIGRKTNMNKAEKAISRLFADSIASTDTSGNCNVSTATRNGISVQTQVRFTKNLIQFFLLTCLCDCLHICFYYQQKIADRSGSVNPNNNVCAATNNKHGDKQQVIFIFL